MGEGNTEQLSAMVLGTAKERLGLQNLAGSFGGDTGTVNEKSMSLEKCRGKLMRVSCAMYTIYAVASEKCTGFLHFLLHNSF